MNTGILLIALLVSHYLADYCLTRPMMIRAKADGKNVWPILLHASIHAVLMGLCLLVWGAQWTTLVWLMGVELVTHFAIDLTKARLSFHFPQLADAKQKSYWMLYGLDQLLHQLVVVYIWLSA
ncbi:MAG: DUF3307 domain-containing protein [Prevotella sp.]|nr:DUF3307 domain-containing protein [Prevotella sp.]